MEKTLEGYHVKGKKFVVFLILGFVGLFAYTFFLWLYAEMEGTRITIGSYYTVFYMLLALIFMASVLLSLEKSDTCTFHQRNSSSFLSSQRIFIAAKEVLRKNRKYARAIG